MEDAVDAFVPICCFCSKVRDDTNMEAGKGPWMDLSIYVIRRKLPFNHGFVFSHGYCPDCVAQYDERLAAYRSTPLWASMKSLREAERRLTARTGRRQRNMKRELPTGGELVMPKKTQAVSPLTQRDVGTPVESRSNGDTVNNRPHEHSHDFHARISTRAYALYEEHGREDDRALEDWLEAERQVLTQG
jgi:hypothetical protein